MSSFGAGSGLGVLALVIASLLWGTTGTTASFLPDDVNPLAVGASTMGAGGLLLFAAAARSATRVLRDPEPRRWVLIGALGVVVYPLAFYAGMDLAGVAVGNVVAAGALANNAQLLKEDGAWTIQGDPTEAAFLVAEAKIAGLQERRRARFERVGEIPFTSERKLMTTLQADAERGGAIAVVTKGAPDVLLARCTAERVAGELRPLTSARRAARYSE